MDHSFMILAKVCYRLGMYDELNRIVTTHLSDLSNPDNYYLGIQILLIINKEEAARRLQDYYFNIRFLLTEKVGDGKQCKIVWQSGKNLLDWNSNELYQPLGYLSLLRDNQEEAEGCFFHYLNSDPSNTQCLDFYAIRFFSGKSTYPMALLTKLVQRAMNYYSDKPTQLMELILLLNGKRDRLKQYEMYLQLLTRAQEPLTSKLRGLWEKSCGHLELSASFFEKAYITQPNDPSLLKNYGETMRLLHHYEKAKELLEHSIQIEENAQTRISYGNTLFALKLYRKAKNQFEAVLWSQPFNIYALKGYEETLREMGFFQAADEQKSIWVKLTSEK